MTSGLCLWETVQSLQMGSCRSGVSSAGSATSYSGERNISTELRRDSRLGVADRRAHRQDNHGETLRVCELREVFQTDHGRPEIGEDAGRKDCGEMSTLPGEKRSLLAARRRIYGHFRVARQLYPAPS